MNRFVLVFTLALIVLLISLAVFIHADQHWFTHWFLYVWLAVFLVSIGFKYNILIGYPVWDLESFNPTQTANAVLLAASSVLLLALGYKYLLPLLIKQ